MADPLHDGSYWSATITLDNGSWRTCIGWGTDQLDALKSLIEEGYIPSNVARITIKPHLYVRKWGK
ncbi:MAG TPA: hypothetical protein VN039_03865 [Nitrospira sp.]|nr:hypothetical protein [Nitrospira sp.]